MSTNIVEAKSSWVSIRELVEKAILVANATNSDVIAIFQGARFGVKPNMTTQEAIDIYLSVKDKMFETQKQLNQKTK